MHTSIWTINNQDDTVVEENIAIYLLWSKLVQVDRTSSGTSDQSVLKYKQLWQNTYRTGPYHPQYQQFGGESQHDYLHTSYRYAND
jgi:hypothetical protein